MGLSATRMAARIKAYLDALDHAQIADAGEAEDFAEQARIALCQGIIDEIQGNAVVQTTSGAPDSEHIGKIR